jgi:hypothetical protein
MDGFSTSAIVVFARFVEAAETFDPEAATNEAVRVEIASFGNVPIFGFKVGFAALADAGFSALVETVVLRASFAAASFTGGASVLVKKDCFATCFFVSTVIGFFSGLFALLTLDGAAPAELFFTAIDLEMLFLVTTLLLDGFSSTFAAEAPAADLVTALFAAFGALAPLLIDLMGAEVGLAFACRLTGVPSAINSTPLLIVQRANRGRTEPELVRKENAWSGIATSPAARRSSITMIANRNCARRIPLSRVRHPAVN